MPNGENKISRLFLKNQAVSVGYSLVLRVSLDALNEVLKRLFREFKRVLSVSKYK